MHHKVDGNFGSEADVQSLYFRGFRFNETSDNGACTHGQPATSDNGACTHGQPAK